MTSLAITLLPAPTSPSQGNANTSRKVRIQETVEAKPDLGLDYLEYLVSRTSTRDCILPFRQGQLKQLHKALGAWKVQ